MKVYMLLENATLTQGELAERNNVADMVLAGSPEFRELMRKAKAAVDEAYARPGLTFAGRFAVATSAFNDSGAAVTAPDVDETEADYNRRTNYGAF